MIESHKKVWENKDFCVIVMPSEDTKVLEFIQTKTLLIHDLYFMQFYAGRKSLT